MEFQPEMIGLVKHVAWQYVEKNPAFDYDDLIQEGCIGLLQALPEADNGKNWKGYLSKSIARSIYAHIAKETREIRDYRKTIRASELSDECDYFDRMISGKRLDFDLPNIRKTILYILPDDLRETYRDFFILDQTSDQIGKKRGCSGQKILSQVWKIEKLIYNFFTLSKEETKKIKKMAYLKWHDGNRINCTGIAKLYNIPRRGVYLIRKQTTPNYKSILGIQTQKKPRNKLDATQVRQIREEWGGGKRKGGKSDRELAKKWGISRTSIQGIVYNQRYKGY